MPSGDIARAVEAPATLCPCPKDGTVELWNCGNCGILKLWNCGIALGSWCRNSIKLEPGDSSSSPVPHSHCPQPLEAPSPKSEPLRIFSSIPVGILSLPERRRGRADPGDRSGPDALVPSHGPAVTPAPCATSGDQDRIDARLPPPPLPPPASGGSSSLLPVPMAEFSLLELGIPKGFPTALWLGSPLSLAPAG